MKNKKKHYILVILIFLSNIILAQRPNIVWITVEDISPTLSVYGDSTAKTPNIDRLASQSQIFTQLFLMKCTTLSSRYEPFGAHWCVIPGTGLNLALPAPLKSISGIAGGAACDQI